MTSKRSKILHVSCHLRLLVLVVSGAQATAFLTKRATVRQLKNSKYSVAQTEQ